MATKLSVSLRKKSIHNLLFLAHKFLAFLEAVRFPFYVDDGAVMHDAIQYGGGNGDVGKDFVPLREGFVGSENSGGFFIAPCNQLKEEVCPLNVHREIADFVDNQHPVLGENFLLTFMAVLKKIFHLAYLLKDLIWLFSSKSAKDVYSGMQK